MNNSIRKSSLQRPEWFINSKTKQKVFLIRDSSISMEGSKAQEAYAASNDLVSELAQEVNKGGFIVSIIDFNETANTVADMEKANNLVNNVPPLSIASCTNVTSGIEKAIDSLQAFSKDEYKYLKPVTLLFSDGCHNRGPEPDDAAARLKSLSTLVTISFGTDADDTLLARLATSPQHFYKIKSNGRELRSFLAQVGKTLSISFQRNMEAAQALAKV